jgi:hypothetical protein
VKTDTCLFSRPSTGLPLAEACCARADGSAVHQGLADLLRKYDVNEYAASVYVYALKGGATSVP